MPGNIDDAAAALALDPSLTYPPDMKHELGAEVHAVGEPPVNALGAKTLPSEYIDENFPSEEELKSLRRVSEKIPMRTYLIAFVELCERFSYYGTSVVYTDFIQQPLVGPTGAGIYDTTDSDPQSGALGMGQRASTGLGTFNTFWIYIIPLFAAYIADTYWGRYKTICVAIVIAIVGHVILVASAAPGVLENIQGAKAAFIIGMIIMGFGTGTFKPNISPLIAEQIVSSKMHVRTIEKTGERVIVDPAVTASRVYNWFYLFINIGALVGQVGMSYAELYVGFWLAYLLPTVMFLFCPIVMVFGRKMYNITPPQGSVLGPAFKILSYGQKGRWSWNPVKTYKQMNDGTFWERCKPSNIPAAERPSWMTFDDAWVDEVKRGFKACNVFLFLPMYWLCYNQLNNNLISQSAVMQRHGLPTEVVSNLDPFALLILIPICDLFIYPGLRKAGINFSPIKKIFWGFMTGSAAMIWAAVLQYYIYKMSPCGYDASDPDCDVAPINVWAQTGAYVLIAISEILASITSLEYAFTKAPKNMRSLVMAVSLFMSALAAALGEAFVPLSEDPLLVWNYGVFAVLAFISGIGFWFAFRNLDRNEDKLNMLPSGHVGTAAQVDLERRMSLTNPEMIHSKDVEAGSH